MARSERPRPRFLRNLIFLGIFGFAVWYFMGGGQTPVDVPQGTTLVIEVAGQYVEADSPTLLGRLFGDTGRPFVSLLSLFALAERDDRIETVVIHIRDLGIGWGKSSELRGAIARLRDAGRKTIAVLELGSFSANRPYYIATAAEEIYAVPGSVVPVLGLSAQYFYLGDMWEKIGVGLDVNRVGKYKSAVEVYTGTGMSDASREMSNALLDSAESRFVSAIAEGRGLSTDQVKAIIDEGVVGAKDLIARGLVDDFTHMSDLDALAGNTLRGNVYRNVDPQSVGFDPKVKLALIYGTGAVVTGNADRSTSGGPVFAAQRIRRALLDAMANPEIEGIVLRLDSPGGSPLASEIIWNTIKTVRDDGMTVVASVSDVAASGAYYVASIADAIVISPGALTGSIGVFSIRPNFKGLMEKLGINSESLTRGRHADFYSTTEPLSDSAKARMQTIVDDIYALFVARVASGRRLEVAQVDTLGQGRVWSAEQALEVGLVDELGGLHEAIGWILREKGLDEDTDVVLVSYPAPSSLASEITKLLQSGVLPSAASPFDAALDAVFDAPGMPDAVTPLRSWIFDLQPGSPWLVSPVFVEIH